jgi:hypothetical protein
MLSVSLKRMHGGRLDLFSLCHRLPYLRADKKARHIQRANRKY